jgi:DNA-binding response OmpR family regulator
MGRTKAGTHAKRILVVDDEYAICDTVCAILSEAGFEAESARTLQQARQLLEQRDFDLILLDIILVGESGLDLLTWLRQESRHELPVVLLSGIAREDTKLKAFHLGADDYVVKPFSPRELVARVKAVLKRSGKGGVIQFGDYRLDLEARQLYRGAEPLKLRPKEFAVLEVLAAAKGEAVSREAIHKAVWGSTTDTHAAAVVVVVHALRQAIEQNPKHPQYILTVSRFGYRLEAGGKG